MFIYGEGRQSVHDGASLEVNMVLDQSHISAAVTSEGGAHLLDVGVYLQTEPIEATHYIQIATAYDGNWQFRNILGHDRARQYSVRHDL